MPPVLLASEFALSSSPAATPEIFSSPVPLHNCKMSSGNINGPYTTPEMGVSGARGLGPGRTSSPNTPLVSRVTGSVSASGVPSSASPSGPHACGLACSADSAAAVFSSSPSATRLSQDRLLALAREAARRFLAGDTVLDSLPSTSPQPHYMRRCVGLGFHLPPGFVSAHTAAPSMCCSSWRAGTLRPAMARTRRLSWPTSPARASYSAVRPPSAARRLLSGLPF